MKRFFVSGLLVTSLVILGGCGTGDSDSSSSEPSIESSRAASPQQSQKSDNGKLDQRTGNPYPVVQTSRDTLPLLIIMTNLEQNISALQAGIWRGNYELIEKAATALANHARIPKREVRKIRSILGKEGLKNFVAADQYWHKKAKELAAVADRKKMDRVVTLTTELIQRCANCHLKYREPLRDSPKWLER